jgi:hypothetical protein
MAQQAQMQAAEKFKAAETTAHNPPGETAINPTVAEESEDEDVTALAAFQGILNSQELLL